MSLPPLGISSVGLVYGFSDNHGRKYSKLLLLVKASVNDGGCTFSCQQFYEPCTVEKITTKLTYIDELLPLFVDRLWEVRQIIRDWKYKTKKICFHCGLIILIRACSFGPTNGRSQGGYSVLIGLISMEMSTTASDVV